MFQQSEKYKDLLIQLNDILEENAKFSCYADNTFTYLLYKEKKMYEISFICDDILLSKMKIEDLLQLKDMCYFWCRIFENKKILSDIDWKIE